MMKRRGEREMEERRKRDDGEEKEKLRRGKRETMKRRARDRKKEIDI